jgi:hypothetical protein
MAADLNQVIQKIPKPLLVLGVIILSIGFFVYNDPLRDECEVQNTLFEKKMLGLTITEQKKNYQGRKLKHFPQLEYWKNRCKEGNSIGSCNDYFTGLRTLIQELRVVNDKCQIKFSQQNEGFSFIISEGLQIMALVAWGDKPPGGPGERLGWLTTTHLQTFCYLKRTFILISDEQTYEALKAKVYREYPDNWPESAIAEDRIDEKRPRAFKTMTNPNGSLKADEIYSRSLFSVRCDLYM